MRLVLGIAFASAATLASIPQGGSVRVLAPTGFPTWQTWNVAHPFIVREGERLRMYYSGSGATQMNDSVTDVWAVGVATSEDGRRWAYPEDYEPVLLPRRFREGEVVDPASARGSFDALGAFGPWVVKIGGTLRLWYTGWDGSTETTAAGRTTRTGFRIGLATSTDGTHWTKLAGAAGAGSVLGLGAAGAPDAKGASHPSVLAASGSLTLWYEAFDGQVSRIGRAVSQDGLHWTKAGLALDPGGSGAPDELGMARPVVFARGGRLELWYEGRGRAFPAFRILRAVSPDGRAWSRAGEVPLHPAPSLEADERIQVGSVLVEPDGTCRVFYARQLTKRRSAAWGEVTTREYHIFAETVNP